MNFCCLTKSNQAPLTTAPHTPETVATMANMPERSYPVAVAMAEQNGRHNPGRLHRSHPAVGLAHSGR